MNSFEFARSLFSRGTDFLDLGEISSALGIPLGYMPYFSQLPFSPDELRRARELGQYLIFYTNKDRNGKPLTMKRLVDQFGNKLGDGDDCGKILCDLEERYKNDFFFNEDTPRPGWALVGRKLIPSSTDDLDYIDQTGCISDYLVGEVYKGEELPEIYRQAVAEFESRKTEFKRRFSNDFNFSEIAKDLANLKLNQFFREKPVEVLYGLIVYHVINRERLLSGKNTWTNHSSGGNLICVGTYNLGGMKVDGQDPVNSNSDRGVRFFRQAVPVVS